MEILAYRYGKVGISWTDYRAEARVRVAWSKIKNKNYYGSIDTVAASGYFGRS
jgi:hypothetical protein